MKFHKAAYMPEKNGESKTRNNENRIGLWIMFFGPKAQRWDQHGHSAPKKRKKKWDRVKKKHPTKLVKAASCCLLSPLTTTTGWILLGIMKIGNSMRDCTKWEVNLWVPERRIVGGSATNPTVVRGLSAWLFLNHMSSPTLLLRGWR